MGICVGGTSPEVTPARTIAGGVQVQTRTDLTLIGEFHCHHGGGFPRGWGIWCHISISGRQERRSRREIFCRARNWCRVFWVTGRSLRMMSRFPWQVVAGLWRRSSAGGAPILPDPIPGFSGRRGWDDPWYHSFWTSSSSGDPCIIWPGFRAPSLLACRTLMHFVTSVYSFTWSGWNSLMGFSTLTVLVDD